LNLKRLLKSVCSSEDLRLCMPCGRVGSQSRMLSSLSGIRSVINFRGIKRRVSSNTRDTIKRASRQDIGDCLVAVGLDLFFTGWLLLISHIAFGIANVLRRWKRAYFLFGSKTYGSPMLALGSLTIPSWSNQLAKFGASLQLALNEKCLCLRSHEYCTS
jgi:hypothetical protein